MEGRLFQHCFLDVVLHFVKKSITDKALYSALQ